MGLGAALAQCDREEDVARLTATAVPSALSVPFGAVVLRSEDGPKGSVYGQLSGAPLEAALAQEIEGLLATSPAAADTSAVGSTSEIDVREEALPQTAQAGLRRLLVGRLGTVEESFGSLIAGKRSSEPCPPEERAILETLANQASLALQHRRAQQALRQAEQKYRSIFENAVEGIFQTTPDGRFLAANPSLARIYGYESPEEMLATLTDIEHQVYVEPGRRAQFFRLMEEHGTVSGFELQVYRKDGSVIWISESVRVVRDDGGAVRYYEGTVEDITERKWAEERLHVLDELTHVAVSSLDVTEVFGRIAEQVKQLIDHDRLSIALRPPGEDYVEDAFAADSLGIPYRIRVPLQDSPPGEVILTGRPILRRNFPEDSVYPIEFQVAKTHGFRSCMFLPLESKGRVIGSLIIRSFQPAKYSERELQIAQEIADHLAVIVEHSLLHEESKETAKLEERNRLAREIHDTLAQSLTGLVIQLEAAEDLLDRDPEAARAEIRCARGLARESLEEARRSVWDLQPLALASGGLTGAIQRELAQTDEAGIRTSLEVKGAQPESMDRRCELTVLRIAQEALSNVRHHAKAKSVAVRLAYSLTAIRLRISDDGVGFDPSAAQGILSPTGGGFGLTSMQERARLAGGHINLRSAPAMGTQIEVQIPYQPGPEEAPALTSTSVTANIPQEGASGGIRVLIVDDHEVARQGIRHILEQADDLTVAGEAADGEAAIEQIRALAPDVVLLDVQMPKLDGVQTLRRLRELGLETRVILLSVYGKDEHIFEGLRAGARGYLLKDVGRDDLTHAIRTVNEGGSLLQPLIANRLIERLDMKAASGLTERELEVLRLLATGARNKEIADQLFLSVGTVKFHIANVHQKLGVQTRTEAVRVATERGLLNI